MSTIPDDYPRIDPAAYALPPDAADYVLANALHQPLVRICNLYWIRDPDGRIIKFVPNDAQCAVLHAIYIDGIQRIAIPKARALGFSTLFALLLFDGTHFRDGVEGAIIDQTAPDAQAKLAKVKFAYGKLPQLLADALTEDNKGTLGWANGSSISAGLNARGRTPQLLHISEWGPIAYFDPKRSEEIKTGALQAASGDEARIWAESTHKGGKGGDWYELVTRSLEIAPEHRTKRDFVVMFFAWWKAKRYADAGDPSQIDAATNRYLDVKEQALGITFTPGQRLFYYKKRQELGRAIYAEFPTTIEECWMAPTPGAIYAANVDRARGESRINDAVLHYDGPPVYTAFDIGAPLNTKCWVFQVVGDRVKFLDSLTGSEECATPAAWAKRLRQLAMDEGWSFGAHFLPHDGEVMWQRLLLEAGLTGVVVIPRTHDEWGDINDAGQAFVRCEFNSVGCADGLAALEAFHSKVERDGASVKDVPCHDWASHYSKAFGYAHAAIRLGMLVDRTAIPARAKIGGRRMGSGKSLVSVGASLGSQLGKHKGPKDWRDDW